MKTPRRPIFARISSAVAASALVLSAACSNDTLTSPVASRTPTVPTAYKSITVPIDGMLKLLFPMQALTRDEPLVQPIVRSFTFNKDGGRIEIKETGLRVDIPSGAIPGNSLRITVTAFRGADIAYDFQPHGTVFLKPIKFRQDLDNTSWDKLGFKGTVIGGYFESETQLHVLSGLALLDELYGVTLDSNRATFDIKHFSGYMVSGGRQGSYGDEEF